MYKKIALISLALSSLSGCTSLSGFVNQERVEYTPEANHPTKTDLVTYVTKVDELLKVYDKENTSSQNLNLNSEEMALKLGIKLEQAEKLVKLAEELDQINSQNYPILFTMFLGLNANPSNEKNRGQFWESLGNLVNKTYETRALELQVKLKILEPAKSNK